MIVTVLLWTLRNEIRLLKTDVIVLVRGFRGSLCSKTWWFSIITFRKFEWCNWHLTYRQRGNTPQNTMGLNNSPPRANNKKRHITARRERLDFCRMIILLLCSSHCCCMWYTCFEVDVLSWITSCVVLSYFWEWSPPLWVPLRHSHALIHSSDLAMKTLAEHQSSRNNSGVLLSCYQPLRTSAWHLRRSNCRKSEQILLVSACCLLILNHFCCCRSSQHEFALLHSTETVLVYFSWTFCWMMFVNRTQLLLYSACAWTSSTAHSEYRMCSYFSRCHFNDYFDWNTVRIRADCFQVYTRWCSKTSQGDVRSSESHKFTSAAW